MQLKTCLITNLMVGVRVVVSYRPLYCTVARTPSEARDGTSTKKKTFPKTARVAAIRDVTRVNVSTVMDGSEIFRTACGVLGKRTKRPRHCVFNGGGECGKFLDDDRFL